MAYTPCYPNKRNWANLPSESSPINETNLNAMDSAIYTLDGRVVDVSTRLDNDETAINNKVDKVSGKGLSTNDYTNAEKTKLAGIETGANKTVVDSALSGSSTNPVQNKVVKSAIDAKSTVSVTPVVTEGTVLANITINGTTTAIKGSDIEVDSTPSATSENPLQNKAIYEMLNNLLPEETVQGNPIAISDASGLNAKACSVDLLPIQDLHGYDSPWVGGAGKNKFNSELADGKSATDKDVTFSYNSTTKKFSVSGTPSSSGAINAYIIGGYSSTTPLFTLKAGTYTFSVSEGDGVIFYSYDGTTRTGFACSSRGDTVTLNADTPITALKPTNKISGIAVNESFYIQIESGSTKTDFAPYENICPISGRNSVEVKRTGKNILPVTLANLKARNTGGSWNGNVYTYSTITFTVNTDNDGNVISIIVNGTATGNTSLYFISYGENTLSEILTDGQNYVLSGCTGGSSSTYLLQVQENGAWHANSNGDTPFTYISGGTDRARISIASGATINNAVFYPMIRLSSITDATYEPYQGSTVTVSFGQTVYGGTLDVTNGKLTIDKGIISKKLSQASSSGSVGTTITRYGYLNTAHDFAVDVDNRANSICDKLYYDSNYNGEYEHFLFNSTGTYLYMYFPNGTEATAEFNVVYPLANPTELTLTPEEISLLKGNNVISTDGDNINLIYSKKL